MLPRDELLQRVENRDDLARLIDLAERAIATWEVAVSDFLSPPVSIEAREQFDRLAEVELLAWGGYEQAERQRLAIARPELPLVPEQIEVAAVEIAGNFLFDTATHRDFLGAILNTGIVRDKLGDIVVLGERGAQALVVPELVEFLETNLLQVRSVPVKTRRIDLDQLKIRPPRTKELTTVEASLRLDAVASAGFGMSRSKMSDAIASGDVRVNWKEAKQASQTIASGDLIAMRGKGRLSIGDIATTKKQRYRIQLTRYV